MPFSTTCKTTCKTAVTNGTGDPTDTMSQSRDEGGDKALRAFSRAALAIAGELALENVLQQITEAARELAHARYAALGVPGPDGKLEDFIAVGMSATEIAAMPHWPRGEGLLGAMAFGELIRIPRISDDPRSAGFPENHPKMESLLGVPIRAGDEVLGQLYLTEKIGAAEFTLDDQRLIEVLAAHAAIAIRNARLYGQVGRLAVIEERNRIGMDLHDGTIQSIFAVGLALESARLSLSSDTPDLHDAGQLLDGAINGLNDVIRDIRNFILDLRPQRFSGDLGSGLERLVREFQMNANVPVTLDAPTEAVTDLPSIVARTLFLNAQEALANVARHASATSVNMSVTRSGQSVTLRVADDGTGFEPTESNRPLGHGLANMRTRADDLNGAFRLESAPGHGTVVEITLPALSTPRTA